MISGPHVEEFAQPEKTFMHSSTKIAKDLTTDENRTTQDGPTRGLHGFTRISREKAELTEGRVGRQMGAEI